MSDLFRLVKYRHALVNAVGIGRWTHDDQIIPLDLSAFGIESLSQLLESRDIRAACRKAGQGVPFSRSQRTDMRLIAPIDEQEVWAAGVTYRRSRQARMEESEAAASCYDRVYESPRPELFFKANRHRVAGPDDPIRIRHDSSWNVPEPELTLVLNSRLEIVGYTIGNDVSSRDIEGENPLYLPQAKVYDQCCALGPCITLVDGFPTWDEVTIELRIERGREPVFVGKTQLGQMARTPSELVQWLGRENSFPHGAFLLTGTGIVPEREFTLRAGDLVSISIDGVGTLTNHVVQSEVVV